MPGVYVGDTKALVFPMLCDGYLKQTYADYNEAESEVDARGGPWGLESFTLEAVITPYDVNGYGSWTTADRGNLNSVRTPPSLGDSTSNPETYQSYDYFTTNRLSHKMMIYYNTKFQLYLENRCSTKSNMNRPAEYRLVAEFADGSANVESDVLLTGSNQLNNFSDSTSYYRGSSSTLRQIATNAQNALPYNTLSIDSTSWGNQIDALAATATGSVSITGTPQSYYPAQSATAKIIAANNTFSVDTLPTAGTGAIKFGANPDSTTNADTNEYIQVTSEDGTTVTKWYAQTGATNGAPLQASGYPSGSRAYDRKGTAELTCSQFIAAVNLVNAGWGGTVTGGVDPSPSAGPEQIVATFTADIDYPTGGAITKGSAMPNGITITAMSGGVAESIVTHNYLTITTGGSAKLYHPYPSASSVVIGTSVSRNDGNSTITVYPFKKGSTATNTLQSLQAAINHSNGNTQITASLGNGSPANTVLTVDATGTAGNAYTITKTNNMSNITLEDFDGGEVANEPSTKAIQLVDSDGTTTKFLAAHATKSTNATGSTIAFGSPSVTYVLYRLPTSGSNRANFAAAVNSVSALDITASDDGSDQHKVNLTQGTSGAAGNTTITEDLGAVTKIDFTGGVTAVTPDKYIEIISADGATTVKFKASNLGSQSTGSTGSGYTYFQIGANTTQAASNLITAINGSALSSKLTASSPSSNNVVKIQLATAGSSQSTTDNYSNVTTDTSWATDSNAKIITGVTTTNIGKGEEIYNSSNQLIGTVDTRDSASQITLAANPTATVGTVLYASQPREALYLENLYKISCCVSKTGHVKLYLNNKLIKEQKITFTPRFKFDTTDCFIGQNGTNKNTQFFGELYEMAMYKRQEPTLNYTSLSPGYSDIVFYYRWD